MSEAEREAERCEFCERHGFCWCSDDAAVQQAKADTEPTP